MKITIVNSVEEFDNLCAWRIAGQMLANPRSVIGLSTGRTTGAMHRIVSDLHAAHPFDVENITIFGLDEVTGVSRDYAGACYTMLLTEIVGPLGIAPENYLMLPTASDDFARDCLAFRRVIEERGGIDLQILGLGENGHIGFNQPGTPFGAECWLSEMAPDLEERIRRETASPPDKVLGGVTLGIKDVMHARRIVMAAKGAGKAEMVRQMILGPVTEAIPASVLQLHPNCEVVLDSAAAKYL